jgi:hypothetical protein
LQLCCNASVLFGLSFSSEARKVLVDHHTRWHFLAFRIQAKFCRFFLVVGLLGSPDVRLKTLVEVRSAHNSVDDRSDNQNQSNHREEGQRSSGRKILKILGRLIHPHELEKEIGQGTNVQKLYSVSTGRLLGDTRELTMMMAMPKVFSRRVKKAAKRRMMMVMGIATRVRANSTSVFPVTITTN